MDCLEARKWLSKDAAELRDAQRRSVIGHLDGCERCRGMIEEQGAIDMLLKENDFTPEPPADYADRLWPKVEQGVDGGGGSKGGDELVFRSSPALKTLNIPERQRRITQPQLAVSEPAAPPPAQASPYRWPVAFVVAAAIVTGGFLAYKKMTPPQSEQMASAPESTLALAPRTPEPEPAVAATAAGEPRPEGEAEPGAPAEAEPGAEASAAVEGTTSGVATTTTPSEMPRRGRRRGRPARRHARTKKAPAPPKQPKAEPARAAKPRKTKAPTSLDNLIDQAIGGRPAPAPKPQAAPAKAPDADLPEQLTMNQIRGGMNKVKGRVQACYDKYQIEGKATVRLTINNDGSCRDVKIKGKFFGTDTGSCVAEAVGRARFPKFRGKVMTITYPFLLQ